MANICDRCMHRVVCEFRDPFEECETCSQFMEDLVHCKDCKYRDDDGRCDPLNNGLTLDYTSGVDFCSYGERKDENS